MESINIVVTVYKSMQRVKMWWNRETRFPENSWEFGIAQKIVKIKLLYVLYLMNSATLLSYLPQKIMIFALSPFALWFND